MRVPRQAADKSRIERPYESANGYEVGRRNHAHKTYCQRKQHTVCSANTSASASQVTCCFRSLCISPLSYSMSRMCRLNKLYNIIQYTPLSLICGIWITEYTIRMLSIFLFPSVCFCHYACVLLSSWVWHQSVFQLSYLFHIRISSPVIVEFKSVFI